MELASGVYKPRDPRTTALYKAWIRRSKRRPRTIHHQGRGVFMVAGEQIRLPSRKK